VTCRSYETASRALPGKDLGGTSGEAQRFDAERQEDSFAQRQCRDGFVRRASRALAGKVRRTESTPVIAPR